MSTLLPDRLRDVWAGVDKGLISKDAAWAAHQAELAKEESVWEAALRLPGETVLTESLIKEVAEYRGQTDIQAVRRRCEDAVKELSAEWRRLVPSKTDAAAVGRFYDQSAAQIEDLMWWHTLQDDTTPLAYVTALEFAKEAQCAGDFLDFGSGVGAGGLLFARQGYSVALADISSTLLAFSEWRFARRGLRAPEIYNLNSTSLPPARFGFVTAMDVFEHLLDPVSSIDLLDKAIRTGGYIFGRFGGDVEADPDRPQHIVGQDFGPVFDRLRDRGFVEVWCDDWKWGHQAFQKRR